MSYARFGEASDVYVYLDVGGYLRCCACDLDGDFTTKVTAEMLAHLDEHRAKGDLVPDRTLARLRDEAAKNDEWMASGRPHESEVDL